MSALYRIATGRAADRTAEVLASRAADARASGDADWHTGDGGRDEAAERAATDGSRTRTSQE